MSDPVAPLSPYRALRRLTAGRDAPFDGMLVQRRDDAPCDLVDARPFDVDWPGWSAAVEGHVLAPLDVVRRAGGHDIVLPHCPETVAAFIERRERCLRPLRQGEAVTMAVSAVRGLAELDAPARRTSAQWWLTGDGKPVLVPGVGSASAADATRELITRVAFDADSPPWSRVYGAVSAERLVTRELDEAEAALFAWAAPEPLGTDALAPRPARSLVPGAEREAFAVSAAPTEHEDGWLARAARSVDADAADILSRITTALWRSGREAAPRRGVWAVAAAAVAIVLAGGLLWPDPEGAGDTADASERAVVAAEDEAVGEAVAGDHAVNAGEDLASTAASGDLVGSVARLLDARAACGAKTTCLQAVQLDPSAAFEPGAIDLGGSVRRIALLDDLGDIAVLRVAADDEAMPSQIVVIVRQRDRWLLRDVYDVAQQPSGG